MVMVKGIKGKKVDQYEADVVRQEVCSRDEKMHVGMSGL